MKIRLIKKANLHGTIYQGEYLPFMKRNTKYVRYAINHPRSLYPYIARLFGDYLTESFYRKEV